MSLVLIVWVGYFVHFLKDEDMHYRGNDVYAMARTSNLNEELGQVRTISGTGYVTGTLKKVDLGRV